VKASVNDEVGTLLRSMSEARVLGAVITDSAKPGVLGFVDVLDLMVYILDSVSESTKDITKETIQNLKWEGQCFSRVASGDLINYSNNDPFVTASPNTNLLECVTLFAKAHRLAVMDGNKIINVISQFDILEFLATRGILIGHKVDRPIVQAGLGPLGASSVKKDVNVIDVLRYMKNSNLSGVAVVDNDGKMIANFSAADLLGLNENNFQLLSLPVHDYLTRIHGFPKPPVFCNVNDTVEVVMLRMLVHKVHRIYITDESMSASGVITLTDLMQFLLVTESM